MSLLLHAELMVCGVLFGAVLLHVLIGLRHQERRLHFTFALTSFFAAGECLAAYWRYQPASAADFVHATKWSHSLQFTFGICLIWFVSYYARLRRRLSVSVLTASTGLIVALQVLLPYGLTFDRMPVLKRLTLPWGEEIVSPAGAPTAGILLAHLVSLGLVCYVVYACIHLWRVSLKRKAAYLSAGFAPIILVAWPHGMLVNWGVISPPYLYSFTFLSLVLVMTFRLTGDVVGAAALARTVERQELRWRTLLEQVQLLVVGLTKDGTFEYVNPFTEKTTGYSREALIGRGLEMFHDSADFGAASDVLRRVLEGQSVGYPKLKLLRADGTQRTILWSAVALHDDSGAVAGVLGIGSDVTEREAAEGARDEAIRQLEELTARLEGENLYLKEEIEVRTGPKTIVGTSPAMRYVVHQVQLVAKTRATVLVEGETGVGKELVAHAIHDLSGRASAPFISVNCAAMAPTLVETELFGCEKGAYTGADRMRKGRFELADGGTLFLDEVGELSLEVQAKLLRVLQEGEFERVGGQQTRRVDVRIVSATNRDLAADVATGRFREDLFYRLRIFPITVPPLRDRPDDIPLLVEHFTRAMSQRYGHKISEIPGPVMQVLSAYSWPGNVRELANVIERAVISTPGPRLSLPPDFRRQLPSSHSKSGARSTLLEVERSHILGVLGQTNWKIHGPGGAAEILGLHPNTLRSRMAKMGIRRQAAAAAR